MRQTRPFGGKRRRPYRGRLQSQSQGRPLVVRPPSRDFRDPGVHKIPGRIQKIPDRFKNTKDMFGSLAGPGPNSISSSVDCDFYTDSLCLGVKQYPMWVEVERPMNRGWTWSQLPGSWLVIGELSSAKHFHCLNLEYSFRKLRTKGFCKGAGLFTVIWEYLINQVKFYTCGYSIIIYR